MTLTLLFDLDDTLINTNTEEFIPAYFQALSEHLAPYVSPNLLLPSLLAATRRMLESEDPSRTLQEVFESDFYNKIGIPKEQLIEPLETFYDHIFPRLEAKTQPRPEALPLIEWAFAQGYRLAIATDPLFPRKATHHRLRWAGFDPAQFELISTFETFHFTKTHPAYYAEFLGQLGWHDGPILMVGNDPVRDILPATRLGLKTYFVEGDSASSPGLEAGRGKLTDLRPWLESTDLATLEPSFNSREAVLAILQSTPAILHSLTCPLPPDQWNLKPSADDWALNEVICHLRDTEREIHQVQLKLMLERADAFIPRPDTAVWASERDYLHVNGVAALSEFTSARLATLEMLTAAPEAVWSRRARHAIFGPTHFLEVCGFMADHDRMHIQQVWKTLQRLRKGRV
jgi:FMN phosphatase YigB (HAD superfamily)